MEFDDLLKPSWIDSYNMRLANCQSMLEHCTSKQRPSVTVNQCQEQQLGTETVTELHFERRLCLVAWTNCVMACGTRAYCFENAMGRKLETLVFELTFVFVFKTKEKPLRKIDIVNSYRLTFESVTRHPFRKRELDANKGSLQKSQN